MSSLASRRGYLDWLRGVAVLVMIEWHMFDSWTRVSDSYSREFTYAMIVGGLGAPLFLFLAGVAVSMSAGSKLRRWGDSSAAARAVAWRGVEIFGLAFLFRVQAWILGWGPVGTLLKVDILNIMGPSISAAALLWRSVGTFRARLVVFAVAAAATSLVAPLVRSWSAVAALPDPIEAYVRPTASLSNFVFFPWAGFVFVGAIAGALLDRALTIDQERRAVATLSAAGIAAAILGYGGSYLPSVYRESDFWTTSPAFFLIRLGILTAAIGAAYLWESRPGGHTKWSPLRQLGRTSFFIYWIHVEMIYGLISLDLHAGLSWRETWIAYVLFTLFMLLCSIAKERVATWWRTRAAGPSRLRPANPIQPS
jgi:uncharacterized membrane protein